MPDVTREQVRKAVRAGWFHSLAIDNDPDRERAIDLVTDELLAGEGTGQPARPPWAGDDVTGSTLLLGVWFPNCPPDTDPEIVADCVAVILNEERDRNGGTEGAVEIAGIPAPQWLTPETLANLKRAASGEGTQPDPEGDHAD